MWYYTGTVEHALAKDEMQRYEEAIDLEEVVRSSALPLLHERQMKMQLFKAHLSSSLSIRQATDHFH